MLYKRRDRFALSSNNKKIVNRLMKPFNNDKGSSSISPLVWGVLAILGLTLVSWMTALIIHLRAENGVQTITYNLSDAICESGELTTSIQNDFKKKYDKLKYYTGDYKVYYYKYSYKTGNFERTLVGTSTNGDPIANVKFAKGDNVQVVFMTSDAVFLDKVSGLFSATNSSAGLSAEAGGKVY